MLRFPTGALLLMFLTGACAQEFELYVSAAGNFEQVPWQILKYDIPSVGLLGEVPIQRIASDNDPLCESMQ